MHKSKLEKLTEILIGEAAVHLLDKNLALNGAMLAHRLKEMAAVENDPERLEGLRAALDEVQTEFLSARESVGAPVFGAADAQSRKKH
ncbi:hypothetical protein NG99_05765 [Erwinia typographi]|uniref:Uncharacterized protein n=1 Tax=Erwinia typographi TaxID=371042 RepID=A0A0A3ZBX6_9GAMM|nr:hypothetical protein [Erwinia typographi]KGT95131.1 hypothetical protein NG99_05765 [Erwinia typographi]